ncbi:unnamed protein product [Camellia sinensis]
MEEMNGDHMHGMTGDPYMHRGRKMMMMHMTFFWGTDSEILFSGWPGSHSGMYALALLLVLFLALLVEWLSHCRLLAGDRDGSNRVAAGLTRTLVHVLRVGLAYMVMLAVMSFNVGVFLAAVGGHALGFFLFGSRVLEKPSQPSDSGKTSDVPTMSC